eukprot:3960780-Amphidinium_carterae.1
MCAYCAVSRNSCPHHNREEVEAGASLEGKAVELGPCTFNLCDTEQIWDFTDEGFIRNAGAHMTRLHSASCSSHDTSIKMLF